MERTRVTGEEAARLRLSLAEAGVALYEDAPGPRTPLDASAYADLLRSLVASGDARLVVAIPCLLAANDGPSASRSAAEAAAGLGAEDRGRLGLLYRLARALLVSRAPDLRRLLGGVPRLDPVSLEPEGLRDPAEDCGEALVREAADLEEEADLPRVSADAERAFDTWLGILAAKGPIHEPS